MILVDPPRWPAHGRLWSHVVSDSSLDELHAFARRAGLPERSFEGDHYDVPEERYAELLAAGAEPVSGTELARRLRDSGLRFRKRKGERPLARVRGGFPWMPEPHVVEVVASPHEPPPSAGAAVVLIGAGDRILLVRNTSRPGWAAPGGKREPGETVREAAVREVDEELAVRLDPRALVPVGYERITFEGDLPPWWVGQEVNHLAVLGVRLPDVVPLRPDPAEIAEARWVDRPTAQQLAGEQVFWPLLDRWWGRHTS